MALNTELVGKSYEPYTYEVAREKIREYASALGETDPRYFSDGDDCVAPPTFAACYTIIKGGAPLFADPELGAHWNLVHGSQRFDFGRPCRPGDVLTCTTTLKDITSRGRNQFVTVEVDCRFVGQEGRGRDDGEQACLSTQVIVFFGGGDADTEGEE